MSKRRSREVAEFLSELERLGCTVTLTGSGHFRVTRPGYPGAVTVSRSPGNNRGLMNARGDVRRYLGIEI